MNVLVYYLCVSDDFALPLVDQNPFHPCFFLSPDFHELWHRVMSTCLFTEFKGQWGHISTWTGDLFSALLVSLMVLQLMLGYQNPFWPRFM